MSQVSLWSIILCQELAHRIEVLRGHISASKYLNGIVLVLGAKTTICFGVVGNRRNRSFVYFSAISRHCGNYSLERIFLYNSAFSGNFFFFSLAHLPLWQSDGHMLLEGKRENIGVERLIRWMECLLGCSNGRLLCYIPLCWWWLV